jgi:dolichol-phosphate mannosyltransferase
LLVAPLLDASLDKIEERRLSFESRKAFNVTELHPRVSKYACVIPVKNEGQRLHSQLRRMDCHSLRALRSVDVIIADAPSNDGSTESNVLREIGVTSVVVADEDSGLSKSLRCAFLYCLERDYAGIILMDGNDKDDPSGLALFVEKLEQGWDYIQGSRFAKGGYEQNTPLYRKFLIRFVHAPYYSLLCGKRLTDTTNGFRAFSSKFVGSEDLALKLNRMDKLELPYFMSWVACRRSFRVLEVPVSRSYPESGPVPTKIVGLKGHMGMVWPLVLLTAKTLKAVAPRYRSDRQQRSQPSCPAR